ncbi:MAG: TRAP transporter substrate-binding protein DctP [Myxococcota bacterium]
MRALFFVALMALSTSAHATTLRFASLAPSHSAWGKLLDQMARVIERKTEGRVVLKMYLDGKLGDEATVIKKLGRGLDGAFLTGQGLGLVHPPVRVLELPFLIGSLEDADRARAAIWDELVEGVASQTPYVLLGPGETGMVRLFSKSRIDGLPALREARVWVWEGDLIAARTLQIFEISPRPLDILSVVQQLKTGGVDTVYNSAAGAVALGWTGDLKTVTERPLAYASGGSLMTSRSFLRLSLEDQAVLREVAEAFGQQIIERIRSDNAETLARLTGPGGGLEGVSIPKARYDELAAVARTHWSELARQLKAEALLAKVQGALE